ncbi:hypothetical protein CKAH01_11115 [Colletotrichum kahawae]|uniref:Uncharacterized protein n=1 Tax=Colletotrichum kahawae TaxID=34407 RepID=A0AAD9XVW0_COLKA|nr:hypothetical protein CKAH01_11115 [Colletotrichum kahawae]
MTTRPKICKNRHYQRKRGVLFIYGFMGRVYRWAWEHGKSGVHNNGRATSKWNMGNIFPSTSFFCQCRSLPCRQGDTDSLARRENLGWDDEDTIVNQQIFSNHITELQGSCTIGYHILFPIATCM